MSDYAGKGQDGRKLVAVVHVDMVGYSRLIERDDVGTLVRLRALRETVFDPAVLRCGGRVVQTAGDSLLVIFDSITEAVRCAVHVQREILICDGDHPDDRRMRFRMGIDMGDVIADRTDLHGTGVIVAARLQSVCPPGAICVSRAVRDHVRDQLELTFEPLGALALKNLSRPVEAFVTRVDAASEPARTTSAHPPLSGAVSAPRLSMLVLPFANRSGRAEDDILAETITDDLTQEMASIAGHVVVAATSAATLKGQSVDIRHVGETFCVRYVIEGSVRRMADTLRVNVQLISTASNTRLWGDRLEEDVGDLAAGLERMIQRLRGVLDVKILDVEIAQGERERPGNPDAYDLVLRGWAGWSTPPSTDHLRRMTGLLEDALRLDASSVPAMWTLADWLMNRYMGFFESSDWGGKDLLERAEAVLAAAVDAEPNNEWVRSSRCALRRAQGRWGEARAEVSRLLDMFPNSAKGYGQLGRLELIEGRPEAAIEALRVSSRLDPLSNERSWKDALLGESLVLAGRDAEAIGFLRRAVTSAPPAARRSRAHRHLLLAAAHVRTGDPGAARRDVEEALALWPQATARSRMPGLIPRGLPSARYAALHSPILDCLRAAGLRDHVDEAGDVGTSVTPGPQSAVDGWTPAAACGATTIRTGELADLVARRQPTLVDVSLGSWGVSLPGAIGLQGSGHGGAFPAARASRLQRAMHDATDGDRRAPVVVFCAGAARFSGYNLACRLVALGYQRVHWYRGGVESWQAHGLPVADLKLRSW